MKWLRFALLVFTFFIAVSITTSADARMNREISNHGNWGVQSDCTSVSATTDATGSMKASLSISTDNGYKGMPVISIYWYGNLNLSEESQFKYTLGDNEFTSNGWICQKNGCSPDDGDSAAKILKQLLANEGRLVLP